MKGVNRISMHNRIRPTQGDPMIGEKFGRFTVVRLVEPAKCHKSRYLCRCSCGTEKAVIGADLRRGKTMSCGCLRNERTAAANTSHGNARCSGRSPEYSSWASMLGRVRATKGHAFNYYGARRITVCDRWMKFENFLADMGPRPPGTTLDRKNNDGNYEPGNCRWATRSEQMRNRRKFHRKNKENRP